MDLQNGLLGALVRRNVEKESGGNIVSVQTQIKNICVRVWGSILSPKPVKSKFVHLLPKRSVRMVLNFNSRRLKKVESDSKFYIFIVNLTLSILLL